MQQDAEKAAFSLEGQTRHKLSFLRFHAPPGVPLLLISHSIGCLIHLNMLDDLVSSHKVLHHLLLFPVIERLALAPRGQLTAPLRFFRCFVRPCVVTALLMPNAVRTLLTEWYFRSRTNRNNAVKATLKLFHTESVVNISNLAFEEMQRVVYPDYEVIRRHQKAMTWYYGQNDHWCPTQYYEDMKAKFPSMDVRLCSQRFHHAFVLDSSGSVGVAQITWSILLRRMDNGLRKLSNQKTSDIAA